MASDAVVFKGLRSPLDELENSVWYVNGHGDRVPLDLRLDLRNHSPTGFEWGYTGSGPAQLALAICAEAVGDERALKVYQEFKSKVVSNLPRPEWGLPLDTVLSVVEKIEAQHRKEASRAGLR